MQGESAWEMDGEEACRERAALHEARWGGDGLAGCVSEFLCGHGVHHGGRHQVNQQRLGGCGSPFLPSPVHSFN